MEEVTIVEPCTVKEAEVTVNVHFDVDDQLTFTREVELEFRYDGLQKFRALCGSLRHDFDVCSESPKMKQRQFELLDIGKNPYVTAQERNAAIKEYISSTKETGESSGTVIPMETEHTDIIAVSRQRPQQRTQGIAIRQEGSTSLQEEQGTRGRKQR